MAHYNRNQQPRIIIESPFSAEDIPTFQAHLDYARRAMRHAISQDEAPFLSHLLYPQVLSDLDPASRRLGIACGFRWMELADKVVIYRDRGISRGMEQAITKATALGKLIEYREID